MSDHEIKSAHGGFREGAGRKPTDEPKRDRLIALRLTEAEYTELQRRAMLEAQSVSEYVRSCCGL